MWKNLLIVLAIFLCTTALFFYPLLRNISTHTTSINDGQLIIWLTQQSANAIIGQGDFYHWPFFHPYKFTSTYSDPFLTSGLLLLLIRSFTQNTVLQYNLLLLVSLVGNFWAAFWLAQVLWKRVAVSTITATVFAFSFTLYQFIPHLHSYMIWGVPLGLGGLIRYLETKQWYWLLIFSLSFLIQMQNAPMTGYFFIAVTAVYVVSEKKLLLLIRDVLFLSAVTCVVGISAWYYLPYIITAQDLAAVRTIKDTAHFSYSAEKLLSVEIFLIVVIFILSHSKVIRQDRLILPQTIMYFIVMGGVCMLGPVLRLNNETVKLLGFPIPLPYAVLYYILPGLQAFRSVSRWAVVLHFGLALAVGWTVRTATSRWVYYLFFSLYLGITFILYRQQMYLYTDSKVQPEIYTLVRESTGEVLAEFPMYLWDMGLAASSENSRLVWQLYHQKKLFNGVSGLTPPLREKEIHYFFQHFPDSTSLLDLKSSDVDLVVIHFDEYEQLENLGNYNNIAPQKNPHLRKSILQNNQLRLLGCTDIPKDCLYTLE